MKKLLIYVAALALAACASAPEPMTPAVESAIETTITMQVPASGVIPSATRQLDANNENNIVAVDVLIFEKDGAREVFYSHSQSVDISATGQVQVAVKKSTKPLQFVVLANSRALVDAKVGTFTAGTTTRAVALNALVMDAPNAWNTTTGSYTPLPMWGQTEFRTISTAADAAATINMVRAHARIDIRVASAVSTVFKLKSVWLYNASTKGLIAPPTHTPGTVALPPTGRQAAPAPFVYTTMSTPDRAMVGTIYTFEAPDTDANPHFLVVGGSFNDGPETFYRIDMQEDNLPVRRCPLLRNHYYEVNIGSVRGQGFPTAAEASLHSFTDRITVQTHRWANGQMGTVVWDGVDWLAVGQTEFNLYPEAAKLEIPIATTYDLWKASKPADAGWITFIQSEAPGSPTNPIVNNLVMSVAATTTTRSAVVTITAGRLQQKITINQSKNSRLELELGDVEMIFSASNPVATPLRVEWTPGTVPVEVEAKPSVNYTGMSFPAWTPVVDDNPATQDGTANYMIKPNAFTPTIFQEKRSSVRFSARDNLGSRLVQRFVTIRQFDPDLDVKYVNTPNGAPMNLPAHYEQLKSYLLLVRCNVEWVMEIRDPHDVIEDIAPPVGEPNTGGEIVRIVTKDRSNTGQSAVITFKSKIPGQFPNKTVVVTMRAHESNCYIVKPIAGGSSQTIYFKKVFDMWANDPDLNNATWGDPTAMTSPPSDYSAEVLWQDTQGLISSNSGTISLMVNPLIKDGFIVVETYPGKTGNAVVALKEKGKIRWSWHIWVTDFDPFATAKQNPNSGFWFMDRNLGATSTTPGDIKANGLLYQWGRKDPFPGVRTATSGYYDSAPIYNINNVLLTEDAANGGTGVKKTPVASARNLRGAIENPLTYYLGTANNFYDWFSNADHSDGTMPIVGTPSHRTNLWETDRKTAFDPCPDGWQMPSVSNGQQIAYYIKPAPLVNGGIMLEHMGYVPALGGRNADLGNLFYRDHGMFWSSTFGEIRYNPNDGPTARASLAAWIKNNSNTITSSFFAAQGHSVRCIRSIK